MLKPWFARNARQRPWSISTGRSLHDPEVCLVQTLNICTGYQTMEITVENPNTRRYWLSDVVRMQESNTPRLIFMITYRA